MGKLDTRSAATTESNVSNEELDQLAIATIRTLSMDAVQMAQSGHPGTAMAMAPVVYCVWQRFLRFDPNDPIWPNRDRFVRRSHMVNATTPLVSQMVSSSQEFVEAGH